VGRRLGSKFSDDPALLARLDGAVVAEEVLPILDKLMAELRHLLTGGKPWRRLAVVAHDAQAQPLIEGLLPFAAAARTGFPYPPQLQLPPAGFYRELTEQYLLNKLTSLLCASLLAENRKRMEHMEGALHRMDAKIRELQLQRSALRQEEIVEEIEVILLSAESLMHGKRPSDDVLSKGGTVLSRIAR
jgi:F-type H+-transporting ATPase subunit gamma